ncbi:hypothetical protein [Photorhabdus cinerea]
MAISKQIILGLQNYIRTRCQ